MKQECNIYLGNKTRDALRVWFTSSLGVTLMAQEQLALDSMLQSLFGYYLIQLGWIASLDLLKESRIRTRIVMDHCPCYDLPYPHICSDLRMLPIGSDSVDVVVIQHTLEFAHDPREILREVERVLIPEGHMVIVTFNPWSLWGLWRAIYGRSGRPPWSGRFLGLTRLKDWVALLGFDTVKVQPLFFRPPLYGGGVMRRLHFLDRFGAEAWPLLAGVNVIVAKKRVATLTPIKPKWLRAKGRVVDVAEPSSGRVGHG